MRNNKLAHVAIALPVVILFPYALFGQNKKALAWVALLNGIQISLTLIFFEPLLLLPNPFLSIFACSPIWKRITHATK